ncbi:MAG: hypothetical protein LBL26_00470 [Peptococcaceae bacterium]|jgi:hypothetical protein|nr:hypothetical protein [Peptococcaceae bacterium]
MWEKWLRKAGIFYGCVAAGAVILRLIDRTWLIISMGIVTADALLLGGRILLACVFLAGSAVLFTGWRKSWQLERSAAYAVKLSLDKTQSPGVIRGEITRLLGVRPRLKEPLTLGLSQMDSIDRKQAKLKEILDRNDAASLNEVVSTLDEAEQTVCKNLVRVLNRAILWDPYEANKPGKEAVFEGHQRYIGRILDKNESILTMCDTLLAETVSYLGEKTSGADDGALGLVAMTEVMRSLRGMDGGDES